MRTTTLAALLATGAALAGCSGNTGLTTSSVSGTAATTANAAPPAPTHDVTSRALQVGSTAARATKCGYNFDPVKLKANFLASEGKINPADVAKAEQVYNVAYNGVMKGVAAKPNYCTDTKTAEIKEDLGRHLAGDFTPRPPKVEVAEPGFFDSWGDGNGSESGPKFGTSDWWDKQAEKKGG
jgi:hypothetical protein